MKKALLGVLALTSMASFADVTGYVKSNSEAKAETDVKKEESGVKFEGQKFPIKTKLDLGFFLDSNKDTFLFTGAKFSAEAQKKGVAREAYAGTRFDSMLTENTSLILNAVAGYTNFEKGFDKKEKSIETALKEHLDAKKVWSAEKKAELERKDKEDDRNNFYKDNGFRLTENDRLLLSAVVKNTTESSNLLAGTIYNLDKDVYSRLESFVKAGKQFEGFRLDAELTHILGKDKEFVPANENSLDLLTESDVTNLNVGGRLKGNVKLSTKLLNDTLELSTKPSFDLGLLLEQESKKQNVMSERYFKAGIENVAKYTGLKNTTVEGKLVYDAEVANLPIESGKTYTDGDYKYTENAGSLLNLPKAVLNVKYDDKKLLVNTENEVKFFVGTYLGKIKVGEEDLERSALEAVKFDSKNKLAYKLTDNLGVNAIANYKLEDAIINSTVQHNLLTGAGVSYSKDALKAELNGRYNLFYGKQLKEDESGYDHKSYHDVLGNLKISNMIKNGKLTFTPSLNAFVVSKLVEKEAFFGVRPSLKTTYTINSFELNNELGFKYLLTSAMEKLEGETKAEAFILSSYAAMANFGVNYLINENHKLGLGLDSEYSYLLNNKFFDAYETGTDKLMNNFEGEKAKTFLDYLKEKHEGMSKEQTDVDSYIERFSLTPKVNAELKYGKVTVKPEVSAKFKFGKEDGANKVFGLKKISGKGTLNIEYRW